MVRVRSRRSELTRPTRRIMGTSMPHRSATHQILRQALPNRDLSYSSFSFKEVHTSLPLFIPPLCQPCRGAGKRWPTPAPAHPLLPIPGCHTIPGQILRNMCTQDGMGASNSWRRKQTPHGPGVPSASQCVHRLPPGNTFPSLSLFLNWTARGTD